MCRSRVQIPPSALVRMIRISSILALGLILACSNSKNNPANRNIFSGKVDTVGVRVIDITNLNGKSGEIKIDIFGTTIPEQEVNIQPKVSGRIKKIYVDVGSNVKSGQILAEIDETDYLNTYNRLKAELESIKSQLELARANFLRAQDLIKNNAISQAEFDSAKSNFDSLDARYKSSLELLEKARIDLLETKVRAPFDGSIVNKLVDVGSFVFPQTPMFVLQSRRTYFLGRVAEQDIIFLRKGMKIAVEFSSINKRIEGIVDSITPSIDRRSFDVKVLLRDFVQSNLYGIARVTVEKKSGILLPYEALVITREGEYVFAVSDGVAKRTPVKILDVYSNYVSVELPEGVTRIISPYTDKIYDGVKIRIVEDVPLSKN